MVENYETCIQLEGSVEIQPCNTNKSFVLNLHLRVTILNICLQQVTAGITLFVEIP